MAVLEPVDIPEALKHYPYFMDWLHELGRSPGDVLNFAIVGDVIEVPSDTEYKKFEPAGTYTASITFKDHTHVERRGKWSDGKMRYEPEEVSHENAKD